MKLKPAISCVLVVIFCIVITLIYIQRSKYPFGARRAAMQIMYYALQNYGGDNRGAFPVDSQGPYEALTKLFPHYCPTGSELAGLTGDIHKTEEALSAGKSLSVTNTSWIYVQGFRIDDNPNIAILWERREGILSTGLRTYNKSHAVLLIDGTITNVSGTEWLVFLEMQRKMCDEAHRTSRVNY